ncbi:hypothetical protein [Marinoscillum sp. MHG1-6]|uniref:hypothetical protein n=1 Tax=Marinoscillum sp. MHG1-6 TaxID=2959627 RepID=UPI0021577297|nr:hypothetical protein [Marinoscillum sp. MHG1-6]
MRQSITILIIAISTHLSGQSLPELQRITYPNLSEYFNASYRIPYGIGGATWELNKYGDLQFGYNISDSPPKSWQGSVGDWYLNNDTIFFSVNKRIAKKHLEKIPNERDFLPVVFKVGGKSKELPKWYGKPLTIEAHFILLVAKQNTDKIYSDLANFITEKLFDSSTGIELNNESDFMDYIEQINRLTESFCSRDGIRNGIPYTQKIYFNRTLTAL